MWAELLCISMAESHVVSNYKEISPTTSIHELFYAPELTGRINALTRDVFLKNSASYRHAVVTSRIVILSAAFEAYFISFLDAYINNRSKLFDSTANQRTTEGNKLFGEIRSARGLEQRIRTFAGLTGSKIKTIEPLLVHLNEVYTMRNVLAHRAGIVDPFAAQSLVNFGFTPGAKIVLSPDALIRLAAHVMKIADLLDRKTVSEYDNSTGAHRPAVAAEALRRRPPKLRPSSKRRKPGQVEVE
jgi:hypothetical protein